MVVDLLQLSSDSFSSSSGMDRGNFSSWIGDQVNDINDSSTEIDEECYGASYDDLKLYNKISFWVELVAQNIIAIIGIVTNIIALPILCNKALKTIFHRLLAGLAVFDTIFLIISFIDTIRKHIGFPQLYVYVFAYFTFPLQNVVFGCTILLPTALAFERYRAIKHPVVYHNSNAGQQIERKVVFYYLLPVLLVSVLTNFPRFLEAKIDVKTFKRNVTLHPLSGIANEVEVTTHSLEYSALRFNDLYVLFYLNIFRLIFFGFGPFALLVYFNYNIYSFIKHRRDVGNGQNQQNAAVKAAAARQSYVLFVICIIFIFCHMIRISLAIHEMFVIDHYRQSIATNCSSVKFHILVLGTVSHLLLTTNSSLNFFIYCLMSTEFRDVLKTELRQRFGIRIEVFCSCFKSRPSTSSPDTAPAALHNDMEMNELIVVNNDSLHVVAPISVSLSQVNAVHV